jgi:guanine nucleotide-binding protein G(I)/G(S)/G(T) subunit beta-1
MNKQDATTERIAAARREAELLKERIKQRREALSDTTCKYRLKQIIFFLDTH